MRQALEKERQVAQHLKVRKWRHASPAPLYGGTAMHHAVEVAWAEEGAVHYDIGAERFTIRAGEIMVVPAGVDHATSFAGRTRAGSLWFSAEAIGELDARLGQPANLRAGPQADAAPVIALARMLQDEAFSSDAGALMGADALAEALALKVLRVHPRHSTPGPRAPGVRRALEHIEARYAEPLSLDELARTAALSRFHFSRVFREQVGKSPYAYLQHVRLQRAAELLGRGRASVTEAAYGTGFTDLGRFGRKFKQAYGCTPSAFAAARA